ncbi:hypothetical protein EC991_009744, partial [Linnemannia zychae]
MSLPLPDAALTPEGETVITDADTPNPLTKDKTSKLDKFFYDRMPTQWLPEIYAAQKGGDTKGFVEGLRVMSEWNRFPLKVAMRKLLFYCESDRGQKQLQLLRSFSFLQVESDDLAVNIGVHAVGLYKNKVAGISKSDDHSLAPPKSNAEVSIDPSSGAEEGNEDHDDNNGDSNKDNVEGSDRRYEEAIQALGETVTSNSTTAQNDQLAGITTTEPWRSLVFHLVDTVNEKVLPRILTTACSSSLSTNHSVLYQHSVDKINTYNDQGSKAKDILLLKQAQESMSCCLNTMSERTCVDFQAMGQSGLIDAAKKFATMPGFEDHPCNAILEKYQLRLKAERNVEKFRRFLVVERGKLNEPTVDLDTMPEELELEDKVLDILIKL